MLLNQVHLKFKFLTQKKKIFKTKFCWHCLHCGKSSATENENTASSIYTLLEISVSLRMYFTGEIRHFVHFEEKSITKNELDKIQHS